MAELPVFRLGETERKLLALFAVSELGPCTNLQLIAFMAETDLMNYFDLQSALYDLTRGGQLLREPERGDDRYLLTPLGEEAISLFSQRVGTSVLETIRAAAPGFRVRLKRERELFAEISHEGRNEYHARMGVAEGGMRLMALDLSLPTAELAERFRGNGAQMARDIYDYIINRLSGEGLP